ncbi:TPA: hypothetical protein QCU60_004336 [Bacillus cereus]|nr:hypothetical protein [Bacillus cereus]HDR6312350.1 hypothetical protein [Bacillus cereus]
MITFTYSTLEKGFDIGHLATEIQILIQALKQDDCKNHEKVITYYDFYEIYEVKVTKEQLIEMVRKRKERNKVIDERRKQYKQS